MTEHLQAILPDCDLIVGTEEELHISGGSEDTLTAIRTIRGLSRATIVCKRGPMGCVVFPGAIPDRLNDGVRGPGFPVEVYNVLGAGGCLPLRLPAGMAEGRALGNRLRLGQCLRRLRRVAAALLAGKPDFAELQFFLKHGSPHRALRKDEAINHIHWATTPPGGCAAAAGAGH